MKDLSHLPRAAPDPVRSQAPDDEPDMVIDIVGAWWEDKRQNLDRSMAFSDADFRHSMAGMCSRRIQYEMLGVDETQPTDTAGYWVMDLGTHIHDWMEHLAESEPERYEAESKLRIEIPGLITAGHSDLFDKEQHIVGELKSIGGYGYKLAATNFRGGPKGPKHGHVTQLALNVMGHVARGDKVDKGVVMYASKEAVSYDLAYQSYGEFGRFVAQWSFDQRDLMNLASAELERVRSIKEATASDVLVERYAWDDDTDDWVNIVDPEPAPKRKGSFQHVVEGDVVAVGETWVCQYCPFQSVCKSDGPGAAPVAL